ncbi:biotin--[acetyl-CoA-carboxylase] ligase [Flavobacterium sp.]|uniref:biotin--[acetyl-CoA-carboxylase] ligase n=1 Tax=Flavobacterium sp. TaxID=239 RepID=UPI003529BDAC
MNIIKLSATPSTNLFLKELAVTQKLENFTIVQTDNQFNGKGQQGSVWQSESGKNLTFSLLINAIDPVKINLIMLSVIVPLSIIQAMSKFNVPELKIKWPNDILAENKKIAGILIETSFKSTNQISAIIGIGLNVNQLVFDNLPNASSLALLTGKTIDCDSLLIAIANQIKNNYNLLTVKNDAYFWNLYHNYLFQKDILSVFKDKEGNRFWGTITKVNSNGKLVVKLDSGIEKTFSTKEITYCY